MGICTSCLDGSSSDHDTPDPETRRQQQAEAADKRRQQNESRGVKDPEGLKRKQQRKEENERKADQSAQQPGDGLRWQVG